MQEIMIMVAPHDGERFSRARRTVLEATENGSPFLGQIKEDEELEP